MTDKILIHPLMTTHGKQFIHIHINAEKSLNALDMDMVQIIDQTLQHYEKDPNTIGYFMDGSGTKAFCAGGNITQLYYDKQQTPQSELPKLTQQFFEAEYRLDYHIHTLNKPLICWGNGIVMGGGLGLLAGASHRIVTHSTMMAMPEISIGLFPDVGASWFLSAMPGKTGLFCGLTGARLNYADAYFAKLADFIVEDTQKAPLLNAISQCYWHDNPQQQHDQLSQLIQSFSQTCNYQYANLYQQLSTIDQLICRDNLHLSIENIIKLTHSENKWLASAANNLKQGAPSTAALAYLLQKTCRHLSLADVFRLEYNVSVHCVAGVDFSEGVRALLIDKDKQPHWSQQHQQINLEETKAMLENITEPHPLADLQ